MLVEPAIFGGEHGLEQVIGQLLERNRIVLLHTAAADLVAVAIEERDRDFRAAQPIFVRGFLKGRDGEGEHPDHAHATERCRLGQRFDQKPAPPPGDMETVHEVREALEQFPAPAAALKEPEVEPGVDIQQQALQPGFPTQIPASENDPRRCARAIVAFDDESALCDHMTLPFRPQYGVSRD